jgi:hypothetical protein
VTLHGEVDAVVVQRVVDDADRVGEVEAREGAVVVGGGSQSLDIQ